MRSCAQEGRPSATALVWVCGPAVDAIMHQASDSLGLSGATALVVRQRSVVRVAAGVAWPGLSEGAATAFARAAAASAELAVRVSEAVTVGTARADANDILLARIAGGAAAAALRLIVGKFGSFWRVYGGAADDAAADAAPLLARDACVAVGALEVVSALRIVGDPSGAFVPADEALQVGGRAICIFRMRAMRFMHIRMRPRACRYAFLCARPIRLVLKNV